MRKNTEAPPIVRKRRPPKMSGVATEVSQQKKETRPFDLSLMLQAKTPRLGFNIWIVGHMPLITHAWSEKARREMLTKQKQELTPEGKSPRDPEKDFFNSMYRMADGKYGFPVTAIKKAMIEVAHKDKGINKTDVMKGLWLDAEMIRTKPAYAGAICDVPVVRIYGEDPEIREDMVKIGPGIKKTANLCWRAQFTIWAIRVSGRLNPTVLNWEKIGFLIEEAGTACGIGEWRNEKGGTFGLFHLATEEEAAAWELFATGEGPLPVHKAYTTLPIAAE
jgi:hypothetical protein